METVTLLSKIDSPVYINKNIQLLKIFSTVYHVDFGGVLTVPIPPKTPLYDKGYHLLFLKIKDKIEGFPVEGLLFNIQVKKCLKHKAFLFSFNLWKEN